MSEEGEMYPNGKLFHVKLEEGYGGLGNRKIVITERDGRLPIYEESIEAIFRGERERGKVFLGDLGYIGRGRIWSGRGKSMGGTSGGGRMTNWSRQRLDFGPTLTTTSIRPIAKNQRQRGTSRIDGGINNCHPWSWRGGSIICWGAEGS